MIGCLGKIVFETSDTRILTFAGLTHETSGRFESHDVIGKKPKLEWVGPGLDKITFTVNLNGRFGVKPREELQRWQEMANAGEACALIVGGKPLGEDKWVVNSVSAAWGVVMQKGELFSVKIDVSLEEYISGV